MALVEPRRERRNLTILFADLCDSTGLAAAMEPEVYAGLLARLRDVQAAIIRRHGGVVVRIDGDGMTCVFGYPAALEDAGRRATEAALELHAAAARADLAPAAGPIAMHSGIHAGVVLVSEGDLVRGSIEILGDATNVAARLCDAAAAGEIIVSQSCLGGDRHFFVTGPVRQVPVRGRGQSIVALPVTGRSTVATRYGARHRLGLTPFCGRERELAQLHAELDSCAAPPPLPGGARRVTLEGPAGIGKTRLLSEFLHQAESRGVTVWRGYCEAYLGSRPLQPFEQIAEAMAGSEDGAAPLPGAGLAPQLRHWAEQLSEPAILAIDDWQWADDASHTLVAEIARIAPARLLILLASRVDATPAPGDAAGLVIALGPLSDREADQAIAGLLQTSDPFHADRIRQLAGGSPLFIEELCQAGAAALPAADPAAGNAWLDGLVQARFDALAPAPAQLVRVASVIGHMIPSALFAALTGVGPNHPLLAELGASDFLFPGEIERTLRFKHALTRDAVYRIIGLAERQQLHALVAERLEAFAEQEGEAEYVDALAYHHAACGHDERALHFAVKAGDRAMAVAALDRAQAQYRLALELASRRGVAAAELTSLIGKFGRAAVVDPSAEQLPVLNAASEVARASGNHEGVTMAEYWLGSIHYGLGDTGESLRHLEIARAMISAKSRPGFVAQLYGNLGQSHAITSNYAEAKRYLDQSVALKRAGGAEGASTGMAYSIASRAYLDAVQGDFASADAGFAAALAALQGSYHPILSSIHALWALALVVRYEFEDCLAHIGEAIEVGARSRARYLVVSCRAVENYARWSLVPELRWVEALVANTAWQVASNSQQRLSNNLGWLTTMMVAAGRDAEARHYFEAACQRADAGDRLGEGDACRAMARLVARHDPGRVQLLLDRAYRSADLREAPRERHETELSAGQLLLARGEGAAGHDLVDRAVAGFRALGMTQRLAAINRAAAASP